jgi:hypothetical protein
MKRMKALSSRINFKRRNSLKMKVLSAQILVAA